jgi:hypothetical protein
MLHHIVYTDILSRFGFPKRGFRAVVADGGGSDSG